MVALDALLELRVDVHRHLRIGVADLAHDPLDVEVVGEQRDRDVGAAQAVGSDPRQRRQSPLEHARRRRVSRLVDDLADALARDSASTHVLHEVVLGRGGGTDAPLPIEVLDHRLDEIRRHLDLAYPSLGLGVGDAKARAIWVVYANVPDAHVTKLADADACPPEDLDYCPTADVAAAGVGIQPRHVVAHGRLSEIEPPRNLSGPVSLREQVADEGRGEAQLVRGPCVAEGLVLGGCGVEQTGELVHLEEGAVRLGHANAYALAAGGVAVDELILDRVIKHSGEGVNQFADRRRREGHLAAASAVADGRAAGDSRAQLLGLTQLLGLEAKA